MAIKWGISIRASLRQGGVNEVDGGSSRFDVEVTFVLFPRKILRFAQG